VQARGLVKEIDGRTLLASPIKLSATPTAEPTLPPDFGQHTEAVLRDLGYADTAIAELRSQRVI